MCKWDSHAVIDPLHVLGANLAGVAASAGQMARLSEVQIRYLSSFSWFGIFLFNSF
jgi:hypothetical protein